LFALGSAVVATIQFAPLLLIFRPGTLSGWLTWFLVSWAATATTMLFRNPVLDNSYARRLAARTDAGASGARVAYLLAVATVFILGPLLLIGAFVLLQPHLPSFVTGR